MSERLALMLTCVAGLASCGAPPTEADAGPADAASGVDAGPSPDCGFRYRAGHGDLYVKAEPDGGLSVWVRTELVPGEGETLTAPEVVCVVVPPRTFVSSRQAGGRPTGAAWDAVGVDAGAAFWFLPQSPLADVPWFGLATEAVPSALFDEGNVTLRVVGTSAPVDGQWAAWVTDSFGRPTFLFSSARNVLELERPAGVHQHLNWAFSSAGEWTLTLEVTGRLAGGEVSRSPRTGVRFVVEAL